MFLMIDLLFTTGNSNKKRSPKVGLQEKICASNLLYFLPDARLRFIKRALICCNTRIATNTPKNKLDISGGVAIGTGYAGTSAAPVNGAIIEGNWGIGTDNPQHSLDFGASLGRKLAHIKMPEGLVSMALEYPVIHLNFTRLVMSEMIPAVVIKGTTGNVGIGTIDPTAKLSIDVATDTFGIVINRSNFNDPGGLFFNYTANSGRFVTGIMTDRDLGGQIMVVYNWWLAMTVRYNFIQKGMEQVQNSST